MIYQRVQLLGEGTQGRRSDQKRIAPVEVSDVEHGPIQLRRTFSGTLETQAEFVVAPEVGGRVVKLAVDLADPVARGQEVARISDAEFIQNLAQTKADLAVAKANLAEAHNALEIANRSLERTATLRERGVASDSQYDAAKADQLAKEARVEVAKAEVTKSEASLETAKIRLGYTTVLAGWSGTDTKRVVAERFVDEGETVTANQPLLRIVQLNPIKAVMFITEKDYARLSVGQGATLRTDAYPGETFAATIDCISPVFRQQTRQARVELLVANPDQRLKPGMFVRVTVVLASFDDVAIVPELALTTRDDKTGVFVVNGDGKTVAWRVVTPGIRDGDRVQIMENDLTGRVVTLGQQLVEDGSAITIPEEAVKEP